jgi:hypothetical protein
MGTLPYWNSNHLATGYAQPPERRGVAFQRSVAHLAPGLEEDRSATLSVDGDSATE